MTKSMPAQFEETERLPWEADYYEVRFLSAEEKPNKFYNPEPHQDKNGKDVPGDSPEFEKNWSLKFEVAAGEKKGDWLFVNFVSKYWRIKKDGTLVGKLPKIVEALNPELNLSTGINVPEDLEGRFCRVSVLPKENGKYADVTAWARTKLSKAEQAAITLGATEEYVPAKKGDEEVPF